MIHRLYLRFAVLLIPIFTLMAALPRTQSYDDSALRAFLLPPDCPLPCFMGIHPGETTVDDAITILQNHDWVKNVVPSRVNDHEIRVTWQWSGTQPPLIVDDSSPSGLFGRIGGLVFDIFIPIDLTMADVWLFFQRPPLTEISDAPHGIALSFRFAYPEKGVTISNRIGQCTPLGETLISHDRNTIHLRSVEDMTAIINNSQRFTLMNFSKFSGRWGC